MKQKNNPFRMEVAGSLVPDLEGGTKSITHPARAVPPTKSAAVRPHGKNTGQRG